MTSPPFFQLRDYNVEGQIGLEDTPEQWTERLVEVFREVRRVLRDDGTVWIEVGDSFSEKSLVGAPWMLAFALKADRWVLRSEIIWEKPDAMPESVMDRPTRNHTMIFMLSKPGSYFYDRDAISTPHKYDNRKVTTVTGKDGSSQHRDGERWPGTGANARTVWTIATDSTPFPHFAPMTQEVARRMIVAGTSEKGCCPDCGAPWKRQHGDSVLAGEARIHGSRPAADERNVSATGLARSNGRTWRERELLGWAPGCGCGEYVCPACDNVLEHGSRTTQLSDMHSSVCPETSEAEVLFGEMREHQQNETNPDMGMRGVRQDISAQGSKDTSSAVLLKDMLVPCYGAESSLDEGLYHRPEGLQTHLGTRSSDGESCGLCDGTSPGDGESTRSNVDERRSCASSERGEGRQPTSEPRSDSKDSPRSSAEGSSDDDRVPALSRNNQDEQRCPHCDGALEFRPYTPVPSTILDCFGGSGTTGLVARNQSRHSVLIELNADYCELAAKRLQQLSLLT